MEIDKMVTKWIRLPLKVVENLEKYSKASGLPMAEIMRAMIADGIAKLKKGGKL